MDVMNTYKKNCIGFCLKVVNTTKAFNRYVLLVMTVAGISLIITTPGFPDGRNLYWSLLSENQSNWYRSKNQLAEVAVVRLCLQEGRCRWSRLGLERQVRQSKRIVGRPEARWADDLRKVAGSGWKPATPAKVDVLGRMLISSADMIRCFF